ncbi:PorV/PorQ family protein [candidate division KSB1 bacterium]|nr:PorV/PorQ family protein [candidate division KSB1 bacterium]
MRKIFLLLLCVSLGTSACLFAQTSGTGANFLKIGIGPRAIGLGSAFTGVGDDVYTLYWNPGGIGMLRHWEVSAMYNQYFADMYYGALTGVKQFRFLGSRKTALGGGLFYHGMPDWDATNPNAITPSEKGSASNLMALLSAGQRLDWLLDDLSIGVNVKFGYSSLMQESATFYATDIGLMYRFDLAQRPLTLGVTLQNVGAQTAFLKTATPLPQGFRLGASYRLLGCPWHNLLLATDVAQYKYGNLKIGFGAEYWLYGIIGFRGGYHYNQDDLGDISFGASVRFDALNSGWQTDYSQTDFGAILGYDHKGALTVHSVSPYPFRLLSPLPGAEFCQYDSITLEWEVAEDLDFCDVVQYQVVVDPDSQKVRLAVQRLKAFQQPDTHLQIFFTTQNTQQKLPFLSQAQTYYWSVVAGDKAGHITECNEIRDFKRVQPDLMVTGFEFIPSATLPVLDDDLQGKLKITLENQSGCAARDFKVLITDTYDCVDCPPEQRLRFDTLLVSELNPESRDYYFRTWRTRLEGQHSFQARVDFDDQIAEANETNNDAACQTLTIPRGQIWVNNPQFRTKIIRMDSCQVPLVPIVFFDSAATQVSPRFYQQDLCEPMGCLTLLAERLRERPEVSIELYGYLDSQSEASLDSNLAWERANQVAAILQKLGVATHQIQNHRGHSVWQARIAPNHDARVKAENRRVEIRIPAAHANFEAWLFQPTQICINDAWRDSLTFYSDLASYSGCASWQLLIKDSQNQETVQSIPFEISRFKSYQRDSIAWVGNSVQEKLVPPNRQYLYQLKVSDKSGRWFETKPQAFRANVDSILYQKRSIFLMRFNENQGAFEFYEQQMQALAVWFCQHADYRALILGTTCPIGTLQSNYELVTRRSRSQDKFIDLIENHLQEQFGVAYRPEIHLAPVIARIDTSRGRYNLPAKNIARLKGGLGAPLMYYSPCCCYHDLLYSTNTPEGRNYNRRIEVVIYRQQALRDLADK